MKPVVFLFQHLKLTKRDGLNLLLTSPNGKTEEICGNHEKPELARKTRSIVQADNKDRLCCHRKGRAGSLEVSKNRLDEDFTGVLPKAFSFPVFVLRDFQCTFSPESVGLHDLPFRM